MQKINYPCVCGGTLKWKKERIIRDGVDCGVLDVEYCEKCGEEYFPEESLEVVESKLKENNLWGVERREVKFWKSGSSVVLRLPAKISNALGLNKIKSGYIYSEGKNKIVVEV